MTVLASGSRGNSTVISSSRTRILVDAGISCRELFKRMQAADEDPCTLDAILITHEHQDHVQGLSVAARRLGIPVYFTEATHRAWLRWMNPRKRLSYADWLAQRKAEAAAKAQAALLSHSSERRSAVATTISGLENAVADDPFYREQVLAECAAEQDELAAQISAAAGSPVRAPFSQVSADKSAFAVPDDAAYAHVNVAANTSSAYAYAADKLQNIAGESSNAVDDCSDTPLCNPAKVRPTADPCALPGVEYFRAGSRFSIGDIDITPFTIPHDAVDPVGFVLQADGIRVGLATDLGYMPANVSHQLRGCDILLIESNHDLDMLRDGPYPWSVKQRVLSRVGHLSNAAAADFLEKGYDGQAAYVVLAHLSSSNNLPELARVAAEFALRNRMSLLANKLVLAEQDLPTESLCL